MHTAADHSRNTITAKHTALMNAETTQDEKKNEHTTADTTTKTKKEY